jgi:hypothetical protein
VPRIGGIRLRQLSGDDLNRMYADLLERGGRQEQGLSPRSVRYLHSSIRKARTTPSAGTWSTATSGQRIARGEGHSR